MDTLWPPELFRRHLSHDEDTSQTILEQHIIGFMLCAIGPDLKNALACLCRIYDILAHTTHLRMCSMYMRYPRLIARTGKDLERARKEEERSETQAGKYVPYQARNTSFVNRQKSERNAECV